MNEHILYECRTTPLSNYLKSMGLIRILSKIDPSIMAYWKNDSLVIQTYMTKNRISEYILKEYTPSPIISPWSYKKYEKTKNALEPLIKCDKNRYQMYHNTITQIEDIVFGEFKKIFELGKIKKNDIDKHKSQLLELCRNMLPDEYILWLDTVCIIETEKPSFAPLLVSGANDGNFDMAENFVKCLALVTSSNADQERSEKWLNSALFGDLAQLQHITTVGHNPGGNGGPNSGSGFEGKTISNPWDYVMMIEGVMLFAGGVSKRLSNIRGKAMFPFTVNASNVGYATASVDDAGDGKEPPFKGEIWLPIWDRPSTYNEIEQVFKEGRMRIGNRHAETGTDAARSIITMGIERGIEKFERYGILKRKGKMYLFINLGSLRVANELYAGLLEDLDYIIQKHKRVIQKNKTAGARIKRLLRNYDDAVMRFCTTRKQRDMMDVLISFGKIERHVSILSDDFSILQKLPEHWFDACYDDSAEFRLAASIASISLHSCGVAGVRTNLERVSQNEYNKWVREKQPVSFVWKDDDNLIRNMSCVLQRRGIDGQVNSSKTLPIDGFIPALIGDVVQFLNGQLNMRKISDLILPLSCIPMKPNLKYPWINDRITGDNIEIVPEVYMIMKLVCPPLENDGIKYDTSMLKLLFSGRVNDAYAKAIYALHSHGFSPLSYNGRSKRPQQTTASNTVKKHLLASLLFPISHSTRNMMLKMVTNKSQNSLLALK